MVAARLLLYLIKKINSALSATRSNNNGKKSTLEETLILTNALKGFVDALKENKQLVNLLAQNQTKEIEEVPKKIKNGSLRKRPDKRWEIRYYLDGQRYSVYAKTQNEVIAKHKKQLNKIKNGNYIGNKTYGEWVEIWLKLYKTPRLARGSITSINASLKKILPKFQYIKLNKITTLQLQKFINSLPQSRTRDLVANVLNDSLNKAKINKLIKENPFLNVEFNKAKKPNKTSLTEEQQKECLRWFKDKTTEDFIKFLLLTGMRRGEAMKFKPTDINKDKKLLLIKGTKTKNSYRHFPINKELMELLNKITKNLEPNELAFKFTPNLPTKHFTKLAKEKNWQNISLHSLRHTFATKCVEAKAPLKVVQHLLGHSSIKMTSDTYTHLSEDFTAEYINNITFLN